MDRVEEEKLMTLTGETNQLMKKMMEHLREPNPDLQKLIAENQQLRKENDTLKTVLEWRDKMESRPCDGPLYDDWLIDDYLMKLNEEVNEVMIAYSDYLKNESEHTYQRFMEELTDVKTVVTSLQERLGCDAKSRRLYQYLVNQSNAIRDGGRRFRK